MDDVQIIRSSDNSEDERPGSKTFFLIFTLVLFIAGISGLSYFLGTKSGRAGVQNENPISPDPTPHLTLSDNIENPTPSVSLTKKPSSNPTSVPTVPPVLKTKILSSIAVLDGFRSSNGGGNSTLQIRAGRNSNLVTRGFVSFEISEIPSGASIQSATLKLYQNEIIGNPYISGGPLKIDHLTYGEALDSSDYALPALSANFMTLSENQTPGWKEADVSGRLKDDIANARSMSQYRIHFQNEVTGGDVRGDFAYFESAEGHLSSNNTPQLVVKYY